MSDSRAALVTRRIRQDIISGELPSGTRLTESLLSARYEVSRMPVRESLRSLTAEGLVETRPYAGSTVAPVPDDDAADLFAVRIEIEAATARRAAERARAQQSSGAPETKWWELRSQIAAVLSEGDDCVTKGRLQELASLNIRFHQGIAGLSGSVYLSALLEQISGRIEWLYAANLTQRGSEAWAEHHQIIAAVDAGDPALAEERMRCHVERSRASFLAQFGS